MIGGKTDDGGHLMPGGQCRFHKHIGIGAVRAAAAAIRRSFPESAEKKDRRGSKDPEAQEDKAE